VLQWGMLKRAKVRRSSSSSSSSLYSSVSVQSVNWSISGHHAGTVLATVLQCIAMHTVAARSSSCG
jgi:hypothetical protein